MSQNQEARVNKLYFAVYSLYFSFPKVLLAKVFEVFVQAYYVLQFKYPMQHSK